MATKKMLDEAKKVNNKASTDNTRNVSAINDQKAHKAKVAHEVVEASKELQKVVRELRRNERILEELVYEVSQRRYEKDEVEAAYKQQSEILVEARKECEELKKNIESKMRERDLLNKDVVD